MGWKSAFIAAYVVLQVALPLRYYLGDHDPFDERFAWRMFSPVRALDCDVAFFDETHEPKPIELRKQLHAVWINLIKRARPAVVQSFARHWCDGRAADGVTPVLRADMVCQTPESLRLAICGGSLADGDADGVPDAFRGAAVCEGRTPEACFRDECGERSPSDCREARCKVRPVPRGANLCLPPEQWT